MDHRPPPLMVSEPGSFAEFTVAQRLPRIVRDVIATRDYPPEIVDALRRLEAELSGGTVAPLTEASPDAGDWRRWLGPWADATWRDLPWFLAEVYFYRRILAAVRYLAEGPWRGVDPFGPQKRAALDEGLPEFGAFLASRPAANAEIAERVALWLCRALWGNRADLSNVAVTAHAYGATTRAGVIVDHTDAVWRLLAGGVRRVDLVADNAGPELLNDLGLIALLLTEGLAEGAHLHLKAHPFFVSDATAPDLETTLETLRGAPEAAPRRLGDALEQLRGSGRLAARTHPFWTSPLHYTQLPDDLTADLARSDLLILKGDLNYRRLLEDRHWPPTTDLRAVAGYMPVPFVTLRTLKSEVIVGLPPGRAEALAQEDPDWRINGERGVIHLVRPL